MKNSDSVGRAPLPTGHVAYVALGSNLGARLAALRAGVRGLGALGEVTARSSVWATAAVGPPPDYLNAAVTLRTHLDPNSLLAGLLGVEASLGRVRTAGASGPEPRTLDLDLLLYDDLVLDAPGLVVPHPRMHERAFVLAPLAEIAPRAEHPVLHCSIANLLARLAEPSLVRRLSDPL